MNQNPSAAAPAPALNPSVPARATAAELILVPAGTRPRACRARAPERP